MKKLDSPGADRRIEAAPAMPARGRSTRRWTGALLASILLAVGTMASSGTVASAQPATKKDFQAPTRLFPAPTASDLVTLNGDYLTMQYSLGALDRAARLQLKLRTMLQALERWAKTDLVMTVYVLSRDEWRISKLNMPYGIPVRVGHSGLAVPAMGDSETARLWQQLQVTLPSSQEPPTRGGPEHTPSTVMADVLSMLMVGEALVDHSGYAGDDFWVRGLLTQLALVEFMERTGDTTLRELDMLYQQVLSQRPPKALAASDLRPEIGMRDWLWFQASFHQGAKVLRREEGRGIWKKFKKLKKRNQGVLTGASLLDKYEPLRDWYYDSFSAVSTRPDS